MIIVRITHVLIDFSYFFLTFFRVCLLVWSLLCSMFAFPFSFSQLLVFLFQFTILLCFLLVFLSNDKKPNGTSGILICSFSPLHRMFARIFFFFFLPYSKYQSKSLMCMCVIQINGYWWINPIQKKYYLIRLYHRHHCTISIKLYIQE